MNQCIIINLGGFFLSLVFFMRCMHVLWHVPRVSKLWHVKPIPMTLWILDEAKTAYEYISGMYIVLAKVFYPIPGYGRSHTGKTLFYSDYKLKGLSCLWILWQLWHRSRVGDTKWGLCQIMRSGLPSLLLPLATSGERGVSGSLGKKPLAPVPFTWDNWVARLRGRSSLTSGHHVFVSVTVTVCHQTCTFIYLIGLRLLIYSYS